MEKPKISKEDFFKWTRRMKAIWAYTGFISDPDSYEEWKKALEGYTKEQLDAAADAWIEHNNKPPTPADIKLYVKNLQNRTPLRDPFAHLTLWVIIDQRTLEKDNELYAPSDWSCDQVAGWLKERSYSLEGKTLKPEVKM